MDMNLSKLWEIVKDREAWGAAAHGIIQSWNNRVTERQIEEVNLILDLSLIQRVRVNLTPWQSMGDCRVVFII